MKDFKLYSFNIIYEHRPNVENARFEKSQTSKELP